MLESILEYLDDRIEKSAYNNLLGDNNPIYINGNIDIDTEIKFNPNKEMMSNNLHKKNSAINIKDLFQ